MNDEQVTIRAVVKALEGSSAIVNVEQGGCGRCHEQGGCGGQLLTQVLCSGPRTYRVDNRIGSVVGDSVVVAVSPENVRRAATLAYVVPLLGAIAGAVLGAGVSGDLGAIFGAITGLVLTFSGIAWRLGYKKDGELQQGPRIISRY